MDLDQRRWRYEDIVFRKLDIQGIHDWMLWNDVFYHLLAQYTRSPLDSFEHTPYTAYIGRDQL